MIFKSYENRRDGSLHLRTFIGVIGIYTQIRHLYQPLFTLRDLHLFGYEALVRCDRFPNIEKCFQHAKETNVLYEWDTRLIFKAFSASERCSHTLFINIFPSTMINPRFHSFLNKIENIFLNHCPIVFEMNESEKINDIQSLKQKVNQIKERGYGIAVDDFGKGEASLDFVVEIEPQYVKLDRSFADGLSRSPAKRREINRLVHLCRKKNMTLRLERIENNDQLLAAKELGIPVGQGFYLSEPKP